MRTQYKYKFQNDSNTEHAQIVDYTNLLAVVWRLYYLFSTSRNQLVTSRVKFSMQEW